MLGALNALLPELQQPEVTTVIRWLLRVVLVVFLTWLVKRRPEQEDEDEDEDDGHDRKQATKLRSANARSMARMQPRRDPFPSTARQRRGGFHGEGAAPGGAADFDAVINKLSKPREMWEVRKSGEGPPQILKPRADAAEGASPGIISGLMASTSSERPKLNLASKKTVTGDDLRETALHGHERPVTFLTFNRDGNLLFSCGKDKSVCVWSVPDGECLGTYKGHSGAVWSCSVTSDSRWLVTCGADRLVVVWEARESRELARIELPGVVRSVEWAGGTAASSTAGAIGERFVTSHNRFGAHAPAVKIWRFDGVAIEALLSISVGLPSAALQVRWGRGDYLIASSHENGELIFWRADSGAEVKRLKAHHSAITKFEFSHDRELVATGSADKSVRIWDIGKGAEWQQIYVRDTDRPINAVALGPLSRSAAVAGKAQRPEGCCVIAAGGQDARDVTTSSSTSEQFNTLRFSLGKGEIFPAELKPDGVTKGHFGPVHTLAFSRDGSAIASGSEDGTVRLCILSAKDVETKDADAKDAAPEEEAVGSTEEDASREAPQKEEESA